MLFDRSEDLQDVCDSLSEAAACLLPLARDMDWPCKPELLGWLTMVRDSLGNRKKSETH
jgi:hypothetical protein